MASFLSCDLLFHLTRTLFFQAWHYPFSTTSALYLKLSQYPSSFTSANMGPCRSKSVASTLSNHTLTLRRRSVYFALPATPTSPENGPEFNLKFHHAPLSKILPPKPFLLQPHAYTPTKTLQNLYLSNQDSGNLDRPASLEFTRSHGKVLKIIVWFGIESSSGRSSCLGCV